MAPLQTSESVSSQDLGSFYALKRDKNDITVDQLVLELTMKTCHLLDKFQNKFMTITLCESEKSYEKELK